MASGKWRRQTFFIALAVGVAAAAGGSIGVFVPGGTRTDVLITAALSASVAAVAARLAVRRLRGRLTDAEDRYLELQTGVLDVIEEKRGLELLLSNMEEAVLLLDLDARLIRTNAMADAVLFPDAESVAGKPFQDVVKYTSLLNFVRRATDSTVSIDGEIVFETNGEQHFLSRGTPVFSDSGTRVGTLIVLHEVTRLRQLEKIRTDFVANVSHELKTPITTIKGAVETLQDGAINSPEVAAEFLAMIARQTTRLQAIVEDLLSLTRLENIDAAGSAELIPECPSAILEQAAEQCRPLALQRQVEVTLGRLDDVRVMCNPLLLEQALINLISNAIKYNVTGGKVTLEIIARRGLVAISVADTGAGIDPAHRARIFERFYRIDKGRSRQAGGTGLGLAIVKHIVQLHRGQLRLTSEVGKGSQFTILLPEVHGEECPTKPDLHSA